MRLACQNRQLSRNFVKWIQHILGELSGIFGMLLLECEFLGNLIDCPTISVRCNSRLMSQLQILTLEYRRITHLTHALSFHFLLTSPSSFTVYLFTFQSINIYKHFANLIEYLSYTLRKHLPWGSVLPCCETKFKFPVLLLNSWVASS